MDQKIEQYYIHGDAVVTAYPPGLIIKVGTPKLHFSREDLQQAWPQNKEVQIFRTERDVLDYCNGKPIKEYAIYPIFLVECEKIEDSKWSKTHIRFLATRLKEEPGSGKTSYSTEVFRVDREIDTATISSAFLKQINSQLKDYYPLPENHPRRRNFIYVNDEQEDQEDQYDYSNSCALF